eukprot:SAG31_NODE_2096_length_6455_cov_2.145060_8_plen_62_part_00
MPQGSQIFGAHLLGHFVEVRFWLAQQYSRLVALGKFAGIHHKNSVMIGDRVQPTNPKLHQS